MLIDTHAHLWWSCYQDRVEEVLSRAKEAGVEKIIVPATDLETSKQAVELAKKYPGVLYAAVGIHPEEIENRNSSDLSFAALQTALRSELRENRKCVVAVGEIGTDKHGEYGKNIEEQKELFAKQLGLATEFNLPVIIHTRESWTETWEVLEQFRELKVIFHCFSYTEEELKQALTRGAWIGIGGNVTWSKKVQRVVTKIPSDKLLIETDSPLMTPLEKKPAQNEPANVRITAQMIADLRGQPLKELEEQTTRNAEALFKL